MRRDFWVIMPVDPVIVLTCMCMLEQEPISVGKKVYSIKYRLYIYIGIIREHRREDWKATHETPISSSGRSVWVPDNSFKRGDHLCPAHYNAKVYIYIYKYIYIYI